VRAVFCQMKLIGSRVRILLLLDVIVIRSEVEKLEVTWKVLLDVALPPLKEYVSASPVREAALITTTAAFRAELYWISAYPTRSR
jgi:hypothetical protein